MAQPKVSVIMPVWGVEKYVGRAVESILGQTLRDIELICVDDGSPDDSGRILDLYAGRDVRMTVIHQENAGAPAARNRAMDVARGEYLCFVDADDWAEPNMLEELYELGSRNSLELVVSGFYIDTYCDDAETDCFRQVLNVPGQVFDSVEQFHKQAYALFDKNQFYPPWNKLYLRSYIEEHSLRFPSTFWDDFPFVLSVIRDVQRVGVTEKPYYHFIRARAESETARYREGMYQKREEEHEWMLDLYRHWGVCDEVSMEVVYRRYSERLVGCVENVTCSDCKLSASEKRAQIARMISTDQAKTALALTRPHSKMMAAMLWPMKKGLAGLTYCEGKFISFVKSHSTKVFSKLKARR
jgi:glycosyltransferase involved in cell wall biosynthesis